MFSLHSSWWLALFSVYGCRSREATQFRNLLFCPGEFLVTADVKSESPESVDGVTGLYAQVVACWWYDTWWKQKKKTSWLFPLYHTGHCLIVIWLNNANFILGRKHTILTMNWGNWQESFKGCHCGVCLEVVGLGEWCVWSICWLFACLLCVWAAQVCRGPPD